jgi:hypothetical protein
MVNVFTPTVVDHGFESRLGKARLKLVYAAFPLSTQHEAVRDIPSIISIVFIYDCSRTKYI